MRKYLFVAATALVFILPNAKIVKKEMVLSGGTTVLVELAPVDPRSLIQGDYMVLRYRTSAELGRNLREGPLNGSVVITLDENGVAQILRVYGDDYPLAEGEKLLSYRKRKRGISFGAQSFFFQEGHAKYYNRARYGELMVDGKGNSVLVALRNAEFEKLGPSSVDD